MEARFDLTGHLCLWDWCIKNPQKEKSEWPGWKRNGGKYEDQPFDCLLVGMTRNLMALGVLPVRLPEGMKKDVASAV